MTISEMAQITGCPVWRIDRIIRLQGIHPTGWAGHTRLFPDTVVEQLRPSLLASTAREMRRLPALG